MQDIGLSDASTLADTKGANLFFAFMTLISLGLLVVAFVDLGELVSTAPIRQVSAKIRYVYSQSTFRRRGGITSPNNTIYIDGSDDGFLVPANIYTAPTREALRDGRRVLLGYYDTRVECRPDHGHSSIWDTRRKALYRGVHEFSGVWYPATTSKCYQVVSVAVDDKEYVSLWGFRAQILLSAFLKLCVAAVTPALLWFVHNRPPLPPRDILEQPRNDRRDEYM